MTEAETTATATRGSGSLARLADFAYRRRGRMLLAWIVVTAAVVAVAPRLFVSTVGAHGRPAVIDGFLAQAVVARLAALDLA
jgi:hypothetical protein